jgi:hypothetical protein
MKSCSTTNLQTKINRNMIKICVRSIKNVPEIIILCHVDIKKAKHDEEPEHES